MQPQLFVATKAFIVHDEKILIVRESNRYAEGTNAGLFDVPGGRVQPGQHFAESLQREVQEETGLQIAQEFQWITPTDYRQYPLIENLHAAFAAYLEKAS